jgi:hypothetical protein
LATCAQRNGVLRAKILINHVHLGSLNYNRLFTARASVEGLHDSFASFVTIFLNVLLCLTHNGARPCTNRIMGCNSITRDRMVGLTAAAVNCMRVKQTSCGRVHHGASIKTTGVRFQYVGYQTGSSIPTACFDVASGIFQQIKFLWSD